MVRWIESLSFTLFDSLQEELLALVRRLSRSLLTLASILDDATRVNKVVHCVEIGTGDADPRRNVGFSWKGLVRRFCPLQADGEAEVLCNIRETDDDVL